MLILFFFIFLSLLLGINIFLYLSNQSLKKMNYKLTHTSYYVISFLIVLLVGILATVYIIYLMV